MWKRFQTDVKKYINYANYSARSDLKAEVASSYLNWLWWILDPLLFMMVYTFIAVTIFQSRIEYFPIFVFIGLTLWNFFNKTIQGNVKLIRNNRNIVSKVYIPKYILVLQRTFVNAFKMFISLALVLVMMLIYRVPVSYRVIYLAPVLIVLFLLTFGISCLVTHFGVFVDDLYNVMQVVLRLLFYMSGIFYSIEKRLEEPLKSVLLNVNPMAFLIQCARQCLLYRETPSLIVLLLWGLIAFGTCVLGIHVIYKYENSYVKIM